MILTKNQAALLLSAAMALAACAPVQRAEVSGFRYPPAPRDSTVDDYHGTRVADPYRWLEDLDAPATRDWVSAEAHLTQTYLASIPQRERIRERLAQLYDYERTGLPFVESGHYFYTDNSGQQEQSVLLSVAPLAGLQNVALDPNILPAEQHAVVVGYAVNRSATLLAYGVSPAGSDWTDWHLRDLASGADRPDVLRNTKYYRPVFTPDGRGLYYSAFPAPRSGQELSAADLGNAVYYHALGSAAGSDRRILGDPAHPDWQYEPFLSEDGRWLIVRAGEGEVGDKAVEDLYLVDLAAPAPTPISVAQGFGAAYVYAGMDRGLLYFLTSLRAPNGRVIAIDPLHPGQENWKDVIAEGHDAIDLGDRSVTLVAHQLVVRSIHDAYSRVSVYGLDGVRRGEIALPGLGSALGFAGRAGDSETFYSFTDLTSAPTIYRYDFTSQTGSVFRAPRVAYDAQAYEQRQVFYSAKDGTRIPLLLAYRKGANLQGNNPLLLTGYGGFGIPNLPRFNPAVIAWMEMGGVFAIANIRGGGEYGESWHRQGTLAHKQVVFDDFIGAAEWLIANHYTSVARLAIHGRSNGGLLVGACVTQRPDLFGAVLAQVGVMDMLRFNRFGQGAGWEGDYGSPQDAAQFKALYAYSPVHNVRAGVHYPATMVITGDHDTRVMPMHSFKFAAALQAAQGGPAPILLAVDLASGHGGGETVSQAIAQQADMYAFLVKNLAMPAP